MDRRVSTGGDEQRGAAPADPGQVAGAIRAGAVRGGPLPPAGDARSIPRRPPARGGGEDAAAGVALPIPSTGASRAARGGGGDGRGEQGARGWRASMEGGAMRYGVRWLTLALVAALAVGCAGGREAPSRAAAPGPGSGAPAAG